VSFVFFFSSRRRHTRFSRDWSSDVCSSDLPGVVLALRMQRAVGVDPAAGPRRGAVAALVRADHAVEPGALRRQAARILLVGGPRSEERRVGKEWRSRCAAGHYRKNTTQSEE